MNAKTTVVIDANTTGLGAGLQKSLAELRAFQGSALGIGKSIGSTFATLGVGLSVGGLVAFTKQSIDANAALDDMAEKTGASVENLSALSDIAKIGGHDIGNIETVLIRLSKALAGGDDEAKGAGRALAALGLEADKLRGMDTAAAALEVAKALDKYADSGGKSAVMMDLLGKSGAGALPFMKDLAETGTLTAKVTAQQAAEAEKLQKQINQLKVSSDDLGRAFSAVTVPALLDVTKNFKLAREAGYDFFQAFTGIGVRGLGESIDDARINAGTRIIEINKEIVKLEKDKAYFLERGDKYAASTADIEIKAAQKRAGYYKALQRDDVETRFTGDKFLDAHDLRKRGGDAKLSLAGYTSKDEKDKKTGKTPLETMLEAQKKRIAEFNAMAGDEQMVSVDSVARQEATKAAADSQKRLNALMEATPSAQLAKAREEMQLLADALQKGAISEAQFTEAVGVHYGKATDALDEMSQFAVEAARNMQDAMADGFFDVMQGKFENMADSFKKTIDRMVANALAAKLGDYLLGDFGKSGDLGGVVGGVIKGFMGGGYGDVAGVAAGVPSFDGGGSTGNGTRSGGLDGRGGFLAMLHPQEDVVDRVKGGSRGGMTVINQFTLSTPTDRRTQEQVAAMAGAGIQRAMARNN